MEPLGLNERTAVLETNEKNIFHQLDEIKLKLCELHNLVALCEAISVKLGAVEEKISETQSRLHAVEQSPGEDLRHYRRSIVTYLATATIALILGAVGAWLSGN